MAYQLNEIKILVADTNGVVITEYSLAEYIENEQEQWPNDDIATILPMATDQVLEDLGIQLSDIRRN